MAPGLLADPSGLPPWLQPQPGPAWPMGQAAPGYWPYGMSFMPPAPCGWQTPSLHVGPSPPGLQLPPGIVPPELLQEWAAMFHHGMQSPHPAPGLGPPDLANVASWIPAPPLSPNGATDGASLDRYQLLAARQGAQGSGAGTGRRKAGEGKNGAGLKAKPVSDLPPLYDLVSPPRADLAAATGSAKRSASSRGHTASAPQLQQPSSQASNDAGSLLLQLVNKESEKAKAAAGDGITKGAELLAKLRPAKEEPQAEGQALLGLLRGNVPTPNNKASGASARGPSKKRGGGGAGDDGAALLRKLHSQASSKQEASSKWWEGHAAADASWSAAADEAWWAGAKEPQSSRKWRGGKDVEKWHGSY